MWRNNIVGITSCRYLGVLLKLRPRFKSRFDDEKAKFYRTFKAIMGKVGPYACKVEMCANIVILP